MLIKKAKEYLNKSWLKKEKPQYNSSSIAITENGEHASGIFESRTHLLDITSEQAATALAVSRKDPHITEMITVVEGDFTLNPLVVKFLADHARRTGTPITYKVYDKELTELFSCENIYNLYYAPRIEVLNKIAGWKPRSNWIWFDDKKNLKEQLRVGAIQGMETHFSSNTNTTYGAAVKAGDRIYYGGVYSSYDRRLGLHAEMVAVLAAIMDDKKEITHVAVISSKHTERPAQMCGCCRQFLTEIQQKTKKPIKIIACSLNGTNDFETTLDEYLPAQWNPEEDNEGK